MYISLIFGKKYFHLKYLKLKSTGKWLCIFNNNFNALKFYVYAEKFISFMTNYINFITYIRS